ncbi:MAG: Hsp20/alpha crystallin family protein [Chloroflexi bacterium]|nr:Hsp20/alpha crystallin family protein [Chloroflexota bacterium]
MTGNPRFDPRREINNVGDTIKRAMEDAFSFAASHVYDVPVDIYETSTSVVVVTTPMVGVVPESIDVVISGDFLTISGETRPDESIPVSAYLKRERRYGKFARRLHIPRPVRDKETTAEYKNGVLRVTLPKAEASNPAV